MSQQTSGYSAPAGSPTDPPTTQVARDQAGEVGRTTSDAGKRVAATAADQAGQVADEARRQARDLLGEARSQATEQARTGQQKASDGRRRTNMNGICRPRASIAPTSVSSSTLRNASLMGRASYDIVAVTTPR
jgi:cell division septum initiation protein DivIVA